MLSSNTMLRKALKDWSNCNWNAIRSSHNKTSQTNNQLRAQIKTPLLQNQSFLRWKNQLRKICLNKNKYLYLCITPKSISPRPTWSSPKNPKKRVTTPPTLGARSNEPTLKKNQRKRRSPKIKSRRSKSNPRLKRLNFLPKKRKNPNRKKLKNKRLLKKKRPKL